MTILSQDEILHRVSKLHNNEYELRSTYTGTSEPLTLYHKPCGTTYTLNRAKSFLNEGEGLCPKCSKELRVKKPRVKVTEDNLQEVVNDRLGSEEYLYISGFTAMKKKCKFKHTTCGTEFEIDPTSLTGKRRRGCPVCANKKRGPKVATNHLTQLLEDKPYGDEYEWLEDYGKDNKDKISIKHKPCGTIYQVRPNDFQQGYKCPVCSLTSSDEEEALASYIQELLPKGEELQRNYRLNGKEIDIYLPSRKIGFEYNGYYWHSDKYREKNAHLDKLNHFKEEGIRVYFIDSWDWLHKETIVKDRIKSLLHLNKTIYARKTTLKRVFRDEEKEFLADNHIQGYAISSFALGLYYEDELVSLLSFVKARKNLNQGESSMELLRSCSKLEVNVVGGFSKLLKASIQYIKDNYESITEVRTFADLTLSDGKVYYTNGFTLDHISKPSYYYVYKNKKYNRYYFRKAALLKMFPDIATAEKTEFQIMDELKANRVWNCGNLVFKLDLENEISD